jgi:hypothetical protein
MFLDILFFNNNYSRLALRQLAEVAQLDVIEDDNLLKI